ncbi:cryptochrome/photolyase family protein [Gilvimarinus polysaccharolyticus]|uniref:cryptochrome/photolyase family protein n=1 Tax=Gilvimarinus polysaccharolyticus TaxID=863921 RepID=UPI001E5AE42A|nr:FAD-binding domain-containing protein [Gilvimarinus polysaccharolyticus]
MWFRSDLRLTDNPALHHGWQAAEGELFGCYVLCEQFITQHPINSRQLWFIYQHLCLLQQAFEQAGLAFHVLRVQRAADIPAAIKKLCAAQNVTKLVFNAEYPVNELLRDKAVIAALDAIGVVSKRYHDRALVPPGMLTTQQGTPYKVYSPFARAWRSQVMNFEFNLYDSPIALSNKPNNSLAPQSPGQAMLQGAFAQCGIEAAALSMSELWPVGEQAAAKTLAEFCRNSMSNYRHARDYPALIGTSGLSPYLAIGVLSPKQCVIAGRDASQGLWSEDEGAACWIGELIWRDFYMHIIAAFPALSRHRPMQVYTEGFAWSRNQDDFKRWCEGQTGIPIVDAAMRQLNQTGWMHNRLRMVSAMFLTKNLRIDWRMGERYFMEQLIDADFCSNNGGWQWSASTGTDAAPYFRIMNPQSQSERFDADGDFIRRFVPELKSVIGKKIHNPAGSVENYPAPMVDLKESRATTIAMFKALK